MCFPRAGVAYVIRDLKLFFYSVSIRRLNHDRAKSLAL